MFKKEIVIKKALSAFLSVCLILTMCMGVVFTAAGAEDDESDITDDNVNKTEAMDIFIDYVEEKIILGNGYVSNSGVRPVYMYSPNSSITSTPKKEAAEKWYPVYGNSIDISSYIPSSPDKECIFAVRLASDLPREDGTYQSRDIVIIAGRPRISTAEIKRKIVYNPLTEKIEIDDYFETMGYDYQVGISEWNYNMTSDLDVSSKYMALGGVVTVRQSANQAEGIFASPSIKIKVPKAAASPNLKLNTNSGKIIGISKNVGWSASEHGAYKEFNDTFIEFNLFEAKVAGVDKFDTIIISSDGGKEEVECIILYVKTLATERKPSSPAQVLYIPLDLLEDQIKGDAESETTTAAEEG